jgi:hypothetical protein
LKRNNNGIVIVEIKADIANTNPTNPYNAPKEKMLAARTGEIVCAKPAIAQATPKAPP